MTSEEIFDSWPQWKKDIHICGSQISIGTKIICECTHPEEYRKIREQEARDARAYSYWPGE